MLRTAIGRVRVVGYCEAASFLLLLGVAMPLKYAAHFAEPVRVVGWAHGALFILYALVVLYAVAVRKLSVGLMFAAALAALLPFGPIVLDRYLPPAE